MKKITALLLGTIMASSILFIDGSVAQAATRSFNTPVQIVPTTKRVSRKVYRKGRWVTVTTYRHGKRITKKVWRKSNHIGHRVAGKTKEIVVGPKKRTP